jgi:hypothetical protein
MSFFLPSIILHTPEGTTIILFDALANSLLQNLHPTEMLERPSSPSSTSFQRPALRHFRGRIPPLTPPRDGDTSSAPQSASISAVDQIGGETISIKSAGEKPEEEEASTTPTVQKVWKSWGWEYKASSV